MSKKISLGAGIALAAVASAVTVSLTYVYAMNSFNEKMADVNERQAMYTKLSEIDQKVRQDYVGSIDEKTLEDAICTGYVAGLGDAGAKYYSAELFQQYQAGLTGKNVGVGVTTVQDEDGNMEIVDVLPGSAGEKAGLKKGDVVVALDGKEVVRLTYGEAVNKLDGQVGTTVELTVLRPAQEEGGTAETLSFTVTRAEYVQRSITSATINGNIGYLAVSQFREGADNQFNNELSALLKSGIAGLVIDLRNNSGGDMEVMAGMLDVLLPAGTMVSSRDSAGTVEVEYTSSANEIGIPISVLVNGSTYGAAELFAAELQEMDWGVIVGEPTFGKGFSQQTFPLLSGGAINISTARYYTGGGVCLIGTGLTLDQEVTLTEEGMLLRKRADRDEMARALRDAGCTEEAAAALMADVRDPRRLLELLARHRAALLDEVHRCEKKIDCLDYLVYRIKQNQQKRED